MLNTESLDLLIGSDTAKSGCGGLTVMIGKGVDVSETGTLNAQTDAFNLCQAARLAAGFSGNRRGVAASLTGLRRF